MSSCPCTTPPPCWWRARPNAGPDASARALPVLSAGSPTGVRGRLGGPAPRRDPHAGRRVRRRAALRGLGVRSPAEVAEAAAALGIEQMTERERFAPRRSHAPGVYSSSAWPADEPMCMHHELSYAAEVPGLILFGCLTAPTSGGLTGSPTRSRCCGCCRRAGRAVRARRLAADPHVPRDRGALAGGVRHRGPGGGRRLLRGGWPGPRVAAGRPAAHSSAGPPCCAPATGVPSG
ncbi:TauD/TfdA family dioxygenase [Streptomyces tricolor]|nr:TauD/TfdA family dioxygenase [Streptomyces tricolor]